MRNIFASSALFQIALNFRLVLKAAEVVFSGEFVDVEMCSVQLGTVPLASASCTCKLNQAFRQILRR